MNDISRRKTLKFLGILGITALIPSTLLANTFKTFCETCKEAWNNLSKFNKERYQFRYIEPIAHLPKVFIYGDSISIGYTEYVRASLIGKADIYRLHVNGASSHHFIPKMEEFRKALFQPNLKDGWGFTWDVIHFNVGLHDLKYVLNKKLDIEKGIQISSPTVYKTNLINIVKYYNTPHI